MLTRWLSESSLSLNRTSFFFVALALSLGVYVAMPETYQDLHNSFVTTPHAAKATVAVSVLIVLLWCLRVIPIFVTSLLPLLLYPLIGALSFEDTLVAYGSESVFTIAGSFVLAAALHKWQLDRRMALFTLFLFGPNKYHVLYGAVACAAFFSQWLPNGFLAGIAYPVLISLASYVKTGSRREVFTEEGDNLFGVLLFCGVSFGIIVGGMTMLFGSPANIAFVEFIEATYDARIDHMSWMVIGFPIFLVAIPALCWLLGPVFGKKLRSNLYVSTEYILYEMGQLGYWTAPQFIVAVLTGGAVFALITSSVLDATLHLVVDNTCFTHVTIVLFAAIVLFLLPAPKDKGQLLSFHDLYSFPWWILVFLGGAFSMGSAWIHSGAIGILAGTMANFASGENYLSLFLVGLSSYVLTNILPNTAFSEILPYLLGAMIDGLNAFTEDMSLIAVLVGSAAFVLPIGTINGMILYSSGAFRFRQYMKIGACYSLVVVPLLIVLPLLVGYFAQQEVLRSDEDFPSPTLINQNTPPTDRKPPSLYRPNSAVPHPTESEHGLTWLKKSGSATEKE